VQSDRLSAEHSHQLGAEIQRHGTPQSKPCPQGCTAHEPAAAPQCTERCSAPCWTAEFDFRRRDLRHAGDPAINRQSCGMDEPIKFFGLIVQFSPKTVH
jgi:hypothetical protein